MTQRHVALWCAALAMWFSAAVGFLWATAPVFGSAGRPQDMTCDPVTAVSGWLDYYKCHYPAQSKYTPPTASWAYHVGVLVPRSAPPHSLPIVMHWDGYGDMHNCPNNNFGNPAAVVVKNCPDYYPVETDHRTQGVNPLGWGGWFFGDSNAWRFTTAIDKVGQLVGNQVDWNAGITLEGKSYGAATALNQSMRFGDVNKWWQALVTKVRAVYPPLNMVKDTDSFTGNYWRSAQIQIPWAGNDLRKADMVQQAAALKMMHFSITGSPRDTTAWFDLDFFRDFCDGKRISCTGAWVDLGHVDPPLTYHLPMTAMFFGPNQDVRLDQPVFVFTHASSNLWGPIGGYNLGLSWDSSNIYETTSTLTVPVRYLALTGIYPGVADQPNRSTFEFTVRNRGGKFRLRAGDQVFWVLGNQSGYATADAGEVTITGLTLGTSNAYTNLEIVK